MKHMLQFLEPKIMSLVCYQQPSGNIAILTPVMTTGVTLDYVIEKSIPDGTPYKIVSDDFAIDGEYFDAYEFDEATGAVVNIDKAKSIHRKKFREARKPKLEALDVAFMRAVEQADIAKQAEIAAQKQALRDVTLTPLPDTLPEIKAVWPEILT